MEDQLNNPPTTFPEASSPSSGASTSSTAETARSTSDTLGTPSDQGEHAGRTATEQARDVASEAQAQAASVAAEVKDQTKKVLSTASSEVQKQMGDRLDMATSSAHDTATQLRALAEGRVEQAGPVGDFARKAGDQIEHLANRVEDLGVEGVVEEVSDFARRRPVAFLMGAAAVGFLAGRAARAGKEASEHSGSSRERSGYGMGETDPMDRPSVRVGSTAPLTSSRPLHASPTTTPSEPVSSHGTYGEMKP